jgi:hypothetical protein
MRTAAVDTKRLDYSDGRMALLVEPAAVGRLLQSQPGVSATTSVGGTGVTPLINTLRPISEVVLPDGAAGSTAGKGFTCTGHAYDSLDGTTWTGNLGKAVSGDTTVGPTLVHMNLACTVILGEISVSNEMQAVFALGDWLYYTCPSAGAAGGVWRIRRDGTGEEQVLVSALANGLTYDAVRDEWLVSPNGTTITRYSTAWAVLGTITVADNIDHLYHYSGGGKDRLFAGGGGNGVPAEIRAILRSGTKAKEYKLPRSYAGEGFFILDGAIHKVSDGYFHNADIADPTLQFNTLCTYPIDFGIVADQMPDYIYMDRGAGVGVGNFALVQMAGPIGDFPSGNRTAAIYCKRVGSVDQTFALRLTDSDSTATRPVKTAGSTWTRETTQRTLVGTSATMQLVVRDTWGTGVACEMWVQAADLFEGLALSSHIQAGGAAVTRAAEVLVVALAYGITDVRLVTAAGNVDLQDQDFDGAWQLPVSEPMRIYDMLLYPAGTL